MLTCFPPPPFFSAAAPCSLSLVFIQQRNVFRLHFLSRQMVLGSISKRSASFWQYRYFWTDMPDPTVNLKLSPFTNGIQFMHIMHVGICMCKPTCVCACVCVCVCVCVRSFTVCVKPQTHMHCDTNHLTVGCMKRFPCFGLMFPHETGCLPTRETVRAVYVSANCSFVETLLFFCWNYMFLYVRFCQGTVSQGTKNTDLGLVSGIQMLKHSIELWSLAWQPSCLTPAASPAPPNMKARS